MLKSFQELFYFFLSRGRRRRGWSCVNVVSRSTHGQTPKIIESVWSGAQKIKMRVEKFYFRFCGSFSGFYNLWELVQIFYLLSRSLLFCNDNALIPLHHVLCRHSMDRVLIGVHPLVSLEVGWQVRGIWTRWIGKESVIYGRKQCKMGIRRVILAYDDETERWHGLKANGRMYYFYLHSNLFHYLHYLL